MRYIMLIYTKERVSELNAEETVEILGAHGKVIREATEKGVLVGAEPLAHASTATTVRKQNGKPLIMDGPFAETKEQLAGYYIIDCKDLEEAIAWASKIPTGCREGSGCIEVRLMPGVPKPVPEHAGVQNA
jgi:hypothetical protein